MGFLILKLIFDCSAADQEDLLPSHVIIDLHDIIQLLNTKDHWMDTGSHSLCTRIAVSRPWSNRFIQIWFRAPKSTRLLVNAMPETHHALVLHGVFHTRFFFFL